MQCHFKGCISNCTSCPCPEFSVLCFPIWHCPKGDVIEMGSFIAALTASHAFIAQYFYTCYLATENNRGNILEISEII